VSRVVLVLSGGGAKALAHAGAFRALEQAELVPSHIIATSMGAVVGAALGAGMPFDQVRRRAMGIRRKDVAPFDPLVLIMGLFARSLFPASALRRAIARIVPKTRFEYLQIPLTVTATDLDSGELLLLAVDRSGAARTQIALVGTSSCRMRCTHPARCRSISPRSKLTAGDSETAVSVPCYRSLPRCRSSLMPICSSPCTWDPGSMSGR